MLPSDILAADEDWLVDICHKAKDEGEMMGGNKHGYKVIRLSDHVVVKYGWVKESEAITQEFAFNNLDRTIVHVPKVYRYISSSRRSSSSYPEGYLFTEYVHGQILSDVDLTIHHDIPSRVAKILSHIGQISGPAPIPGPIGGGMAHGYISGDDGSKTVFTSIGDLSAYMTKRLQRGNSSINLASYPLVLSHGNVCRRNMILKSDGSLCLLDWGYSGLYPRFFELATLSCVLPWDPDFEPSVISEFEKLLDLTEQEKHDKQLTIYVRGANLRWSFDETPPLDHDKLYQELLARQETRRKERKAAGIPEPDTVNLHSSSTGSEVQLHPAEGYSSN